jgi:zinc protease
MEILDRTVAPSFGKIDKVDFIKHKEYKLDNGIPVYLINAGTEDLARVELLFNAGDWYANKPLIASVTNAMLNEGTSKHSGTELAEKIDYFGAFLETEAQQDFSFVSLYSLNKHLENVLPFLKEIIQDSVFPEKEFNILVQNKKQKWMVENEKVGSLCRRHFNRLLFGDNHPYSLIAKEEDFNNLKREDLITFYKNQYQPNLCQIVIAGKIDESVITLLNKQFGDGITNPIKPIIDTSYPINPLDEKKNFMPKEGAVQSAIRIGKRLFTKTHPDYLAMTILNTVFGGYFGSRLMTNIREDKGYTYGIGSGMASLLHDGMFYIGTEVGVKVCNNTLEEIYKEINILRTDLIPEEELNLVKNYLMGTYLKSLDGPFSLADKYIGIKVYDLDYSFYDKYLETLKNITSEELLVLAQKYLDPDSMYELVVGKKD